jgi:hypothetical protein
VSLERVLLSLMSTIEELLERKSSGSGLEIREYGRMDPSRERQTEISGSSRQKNRRSNRDRYFSLQFHLEKFETRSSSVVINTRDLTERDVRRPRILLG